MVASSVYVFVGQRCVIKFLVKEKVKLAEIFRLQAQYGEQMVSQTRVYEWCKQCCEGQELVINEVHGHICPTAVTPVNISHAEQISVGSVNTIIRDHLCFCKTCARWVPHQLTFDQK
ncbi:hypothetical protein X975_01817, partial [Stegodyphus mimosarum]